MSRPTNEAPPVVVGVADTAEGRAALRLGAEIAEAYSLPLHLVRAWPEVDWLPSASIAGIIEMVQSKTEDEDVLAAALRQARELAPAVPVTVELVADSVYTALLARSSRAHTLVLGSEPDERVGDIAQWYLAHARCPVIVVDARGEAVAGTLHGAAASAVS